MNVRLTTRMLVGAIRRRVEALGGSAMVLARGDETSGAVMLALAREGATWKLLQRGLGPEGDYAWVATGPAKEEGQEAIDAYIERQRGYDPDLWVVEIDLPGAEEWLPEMIGEQ